MLETLVNDITDLRLWLFVLIVTAVGLAEKLAIYRVGQRISSDDVPDVLGVTPERHTRLEMMFQNRGSYILLLASIPGIGAATAAVAGNVGVAVATFVFWVTISNLIRNWLIIIFTGQVVALF